MTGAVKSPSRVDPKELITSLVRDNPGILATDIGSVARRELGRHFSHSSYLLFMTRDGVLRREIENANIPGRMTYRYWLAEKEQPAPQPIADKHDAVFALFSDGRLLIELNGERMEFSESQATQLQTFLSKINSNQGSPA